MVFNYLATLWRANIRFTPAIYICNWNSFCILLLEVTGIILGDSALDINVHKHILHSFSIGNWVFAIYGMFAGVYQRFKCKARMMNKRLGYIPLLGKIICAYGVFFPMHFLEIKMISKSITVMRHLLCLMVLVTIK